MNYLGDVNLLRLPEEMKQRAQWCIAGPDKAPYLKGQNGLYNASPVTGPWHDFNTAIAVAREYGCRIGYIITEDDPFVCIDMDVKDAHSIDPKTGLHYPPEKWSKQHELEFYRGIVLNAASYTELSASGKGLHTWVKGDIPKGRRGGGIEVYPKERFIVCTGDVVSDVRYHIFNNIAIPVILESLAQPIMERQYLIDTVINEFTSSESSDVELVELEEEFTDSEIWERAREASNGDKFIDLCNGDFEKYGFPSQSEADLALMSMFTFYSKSNAQCKRMFRMTMLGQREKAIINDRYLNFTLRVIRGRQQREEEMNKRVNLDSMLLLAERRTKEQQKSQQTHPVQPVLPPQNHTEQQTYQQPVTEQAREMASQLVNEIQTQKTTYIQDIPLPDVEGLEWPPGVVGAIASFIYNSAPRPVKEVAITAALGFMAGLAGKAYHIGQSGLNLYIILIARSAIGKEAMHSGLGLLLREVSNTGPAVSKFVDFTEYVSGPALVKACESNTSFVNVAGEWGRKLRRLAAEDQREGPMQQLRTAMTNLYQKSGPSSIVGGLGYSNKDNNVKSINGIAYSMIGETTPGTFYDALTPSMMEDGFLSRFNIIQYEGDRPKMNKNQVLHMDQRLKDLLGSMSTNVVRTIETHQSIQVQLSPEAQEVVDAFDLKCDEEINKAGSDESYRQMWNRAHLKVCRVAGLLAVADNFANPVINTVHTEWAINLIQKDIKVMTERLESGDIGIDDDARVKKLLSVLNDYIIGKVPKSYKINEALVRDGIVPRKFLQLRTSQVSSFTKHRNGSSAALDQTIKSAMDSGYIAEVNKSKLVDAYGFHGRCFQVIQLPDYD